MGKNPPANAGDMGLIPGLGRSHVLPGSWAGAPQTPSSHAARTEAHTSRARALQQEATAMRSPCTPMKNSPCSPQLEKSPHKAMKSQHSQKWINLKKKKKRKKANITLQLVRPTGARILVLYLLCSEPGTPPVHPIAGWMSEWWMSGFLSNAKKWHKVSP